MCAKRFSSNPEAHGAFVGGSMTPGVIPHQRRGFPQQRGRRAPLRGPPGARGATERQLRDKGDRQPGSSAVRTRLCSRRDFRRSEGSLVSFRGSSTQNSPTRGFVRQRGACGRGCGREAGFPRIRRPTGRSLGTRWPRRGHQLTNEGDFLSNGAAARRYGASRRLEPAAPQSRLLRLRAAGAACRTTTAGATWAWSRRSSVAAIDASPGGAACGRPVPAQPTPGGRE